MTDEEITHDEIDELAMRVEQQIQMQKEALDEAPEFNPKYRRIEEAEVDPEKLFS